LLLQRIALLTQQQPFPANTTSFISPVYPFLSACVFFNFYFTDIIHEFRKSVCPFPAHEEHTLFIGTALCIKKCHFIFCAVSRRRKKNNYKRDVADIFTVAEIPPMHENKILVLRVKRDSEHQNILRAPD
jgi:hypothetical protein